MEVCMKQAGSNPRLHRSIEIGSDPDSLARETALLPESDEESLRQKWAQLFGFKPSPLLSRLFITRSIAYRLQEKVFGELRPSVQRLLDQVYDAGPDADLPVPKKRASAGTILIREWRGVRHRVTVLDEAVIYRGQRYKSLSEVARFITGARWSGPRFFGITHRTKEAADA
jgi:hypothetical protein